MSSRPPSRCSFFFFNDTPTTEIYTLSLHDALPISTVAKVQRQMSSADYSNYWRTIGNSAGSSTQLSGEAWTADATASAPGSVGLYMTGDQVSDVKDTTWLQHQTQGKLNIYGTVQPTYTLTLVPQKWPDIAGGFYNVGPFNIGDTLPLIIQSGRLNVNTSVRIMGINYMVGDDYAGEDI